MPSGMRRVCMVQFFSWIGWFTYLLYISTWVGENIFHGDGDPNATKDEQDLFQVTLPLFQFYFCIFSRIF